MASSTAPEERSAWIGLALALVGYPVYLVLLFAGPEAPLVERPFAWPMIWTIAGSVVAAIVLNAVFRVFTDPESPKPDERDIAIARLGERVGSAFVVAGALGALALAMLEQDAFWIANAIFLGFFLSAIVGGAARVICYRGEFDPRW
jgi:MFS family permease